LPPKPVTTCGVKVEAADVNAVEDTLGVANPLDGVVKALDVPPKLGVDGGAGETVLGLVAACNAIFCASLSPPANIIPDKVPVKNVAIGTINSKNFWSIGEIALSGWVTKIKEYNTTNTIPNKVSDKQIPIKNFSRAINCSSVYITLFSTICSF
jgi:hypothetical protein